MSLIGLLVALVLVCLVVWATRRILAAFSIGEPIATLVYVAIVVLVVFWLLGQVGGLSLGTFRIR